jgi:hypothetical protein
MHMDRLESEFNSVENISLDFELYILFYSFFKIRSRLRCKLGEETLMERCLAITDQQIMDNMSHMPVPSHLARRSDEWIINRYDKYFETKPHFHLEKGHEGRRRFSVTAENEVQLWRCFRKIIETLRDNADILHTIRCAPTADKARDADVAMYYFRASLFLLDRLLHASPAFWRLCQNKAIEATTQEINLEWEVCVRSGITYLLTDVFGSSQSRANRLAMAKSQHWQKMLLILCAMFSTRHSTVQHFSGSGFSLSPNGLALYGSSCRRELWPG